MYLNIYLPALPEMEKRILHIILLLVPALGLHAQDITEVDLTTTPVTCGGASDGAIYVEVDGGNGNLNYNLFLNGSIVSSSGFKPARSHTFSGFPKSSNYVVFVADADPDNEDLFLFPEITGPDTIAIINTAISDISCAGQDDGIITVTATGEDGNLLYNLTGTVNASNSSGFFNNLPSGNYSVTVTHGSCPSSDDTTNLPITEPPVLTVSLDDLSPTTCYQGNDGSIAITPSGGSPTGSGTGYFYSWMGPDGYTASSEDLSGLSPGNYNVEITDSRGCIESAGPFTVGEGSEINLTFTSSSDVTCNGGNDGTASVTTSGGSPPYTFAWTGQSTMTGSTDEDPVNLVADTYDLTVTDALGCNQLFSSLVTISEPAPVSAAVDYSNDISCFGLSDGSAGVTISGGTQPYTFNWTATGTFTSTDEDPSGMPEDTYSLQITDDAGCIVNFPDIVALTEPEPITAVLDGSDDVNCYDGSDGTAQVTADGGTPGYNYSWTGDVTGHTSTDEDPSNLVADTYDLRITDGNACEQIFNDFATIGQPPEITTSITITDVDCNGESTGAITQLPAGGVAPFTYAWTGPDSYSSTTRDITNLAAGTYDLVVTDDNNCSMTFNGNTVDESQEIAATMDVTNLSCNNSADGAINTVISGGSAPFSYSWTGDNGYSNNTDKDISGLDAGVYTLTVSDALGCNKTFPQQSITEPDPLDATFEFSNSNCYQADDGTINTTISGGTPAYTFNWTGPSGFTSGAEDPSGLGPGNYSLEIIDDNGCTANYSDAVTITEPTEITATPTKTDISCHGSQDGTISIVVAGGTPGYTYSWSGPSGFSSTDQNITSLGPGSYDLTVTDESTCIRIFNDIATINEPDPITVSLTSTSDPLCSGDNNGSISIDLTNGTAPYTFSWTNNTGTEISTDEDPSGLPAGNYSLDVMDANSCTASYTDLAILTDPPSLSFSTVNLTSVTGCPGDSNGAIDASASGGTGSLEYALNGGAYQSSGSFTSLAAGNFTVQTRDANGCFDDTLVTISEPMPLTIINEEVTQTGCHESSTGQITITTTGGTLPVTYVLDPPLLPPQTTGTFNGLPEGDYTIQATGAEACTTVTSSVITVIDPPELLVDTVKVRDIRCHGTNDGKIEISLTGGAAPYEYSIDNEVTYDGTASFTGLAPGTYEVFARDAFGCSIYIDSYTLSEPPPLNINVSITDVTPCAGDANGKFSANASGGWGSFEYSINGLNFFSTGNFNGLTAGDYTLFVRDSGGCSTTRNVPIHEPTPVAADISSTNYVDDLLGTITISNVSGGTAPFEYSISGLTGPFTTSASYADLVADTYDVVVKDANGCSYEQTIQIFDIVPLIMNINSEGVTCYGDSDGFIEFLPQDATGTVHYSIDDGNTYSTSGLFENLKGDSTYHLKAYDDDDKQYTGTVTITEPDPFFIYKDITPASCNYDSETGAVDISVTGGTGTKSYNWSTGYQGEDLDQVSNDTYTVEITDELGCSTTETVYIPAEVIVLADAGPDTTLCAGATMTLDAIPSALMQWEPSTYLYETDIANPVASDITDSIAYIYTVTETASGNNCYHKDTLNINVLPVYGIDITQDTVGLVGQQIQLETTTTGTFNSYEWFPETGLNSPTIPNPVVTLENSTIYYLVATNDYGCTESDSMFIDVVEDITVYNAFSPNGDDINDFFDIENAYKFPNIIVKVYNRWGSTVFSSVGYTDEKRWNGTFNGNDVPTGTYYYVIIPHREATPITGNVTIIR